MPASLQRLRVQLHSNLTCMGQHWDLGVMVDHLRGWKMATAITSDNLALATLCAARLTEVRPGIISLGRECNVAGFTPHAVMRYNLQI